VRGGLARDCGHWIAEEQPDFLVEELLAFFEEFPAR
jgi:pimeloyl-ACP methyl ester carboxylesterase